MTHLLMTSSNAAQRTETNSYLQFDGDPDPAEAEAVRDRAVRAIRFTERMLVLNCAGAHTVGSSGVSLLREIRQAATTRSIDVVLSEASLALRQTLVSSSLLDPSDLADTRGCASVMLVSAR